MQTNKTKTASMGKMPYVQPRLKAISLDAEEMICVSVDAGVNPDDFDMGDGGELSKENHYNVWED